MTHPLPKDALKALPDNAGKGSQALITELFKKMHEKDYTHFDGQLLASVAQTHWELAQKRKTGQGQFQIYCPALIETGKRNTIIDVVSDDMSFIVDSIVAEVNKNNFLIDFLIHPVLFAKYDAKGVLIDIADTQKDGYIAQSHIHLQIKEALSSEALKELEHGIEVVLKDIFITNRDWEAMREKMMIARTELSNAKTNQPARDILQYCAFLDYLHNHNFTLLGYREYEFTRKGKEITSKTVKGSGLGLLANDIRPAYINDTEEGLPRNLQELRKSLPPVSVSKTNRLATVHRRVPMDAIAIKTYDKKGEVKGEKLFLGLLTSVTYSRSVSDVPLLNDKVDRVLEISGFRPGSHNRKAIRHILEKYPRDELFQIPAEELLKISVSILRLQERQRIALFMRKDPFRRYISCLVYVPRDRYGTTLREKIAGILEDELDGTCETFYTSLDDSVYARVMFIIHVSQSNEKVANAEDIEAKLQHAGQTWAELLSGALSESYQDEAQITRLSHTYAEAFPLNYITRYEARQAVFDIEKIEQVRKNKTLELDLYRPNDIDLKQLRLKIYNPDAPVTLSDVMPVLENLGLRAISEVPFEITGGENENSVWIHDFLLETPTIKDFVKVRDVKQNFERGFLQICCGRMENDSLNRLILSANMNWHEITILRTYVRYLKQIRYPFSRAYVEKALTDHPKIARMLVDMFKAFLDPANGDNAQSLAAGCAIGIDHELEAVESLDQDRILRMMTSVIEATLRTNYYQRDENGNAKEYLSVKLDSAKVPDIPMPRPFREIFVYSPRVEAIHLRGDKIARGGLRWSDRQEDFRTEVLGLMKAQMVKNAVIVPMGSKGGFVVKTPGLSRDAFRVEGVECYKIFIRGLLDITDNLKGTEVIPPKDVVRRDEDDPYLVVAADKGTASFSDIANGISAEYDFWLGDAFASGGSAGYDHKKMGITARGAWESVKLHFRQLNHNIQEQPFDVMGVGDMGGDVFGNGMLLSEHIRLIAAFNHLHIFVDPDPDPAKTFKERKRLFDNVLGWDQYDEKKLSKGGKIFSREDKILTLTPEIKARLEIDKDKVTPIELMRAILKGRTDLLWFGGIGTYIKSTKQSHGDVGDKANDALRIDAQELRTKVIGEGANLAITQLGRIEFAERGGRMNTDFVDNSGGVNSSDLEVNIKILMTDIMRSKAHSMDLKARNKLLESMTEDVARLVLRNNYQQAQAISLAEIQAKEKLQIQNDFIKDLEREKGLNRILEGLPDEETVDLRLRTGKGLTRPELAVLVSYAKITFTQDLLASDIPDSPDMEDWIINYFPKALQQTYKKEIKRHKLAREIVATSMANSLVNRMGPTFIKAKMNKTGASCDHIAKAYIIVRDAFNLRELWDQIEALDNKVPAEVQLKAMREIAHLAEHAIVWFLTRLGRDLKIGRDIQNYGDNIGYLQSHLNEILTPSLKEGIEQRRIAGQRDGLPQELAQRIALMPVFSSVCDIIKISLELKTDMIDTAHSYFQVGEKFHMDWLRQQARYLPGDDHWAAEATRGLVDQLFSAQAFLTMRILKDTKCKADEGKTLAETWLTNHGEQVAKLEPLFDELRGAGTIDLPMLIIAEQRLRNLAGA